MTFRQAKKIAKNHERYSLGQRRAARARLWQYAVTHRLLNRRPSWSYFSLPPQQKFKIELKFGCAGPAPLFAPTTNIRMTMFNKYNGAVTVS